MIKVLIERNIHEGMLSTYQVNATKALVLCHNFEGFIAGEAFQDAHEHHRRILICKWRSERGWLEWYGSQERKEAMNLISPILKEPEKITILEHSANPKADT